MLAQRAASEGPRWTRAVEDQSVPIPEEETSELGRIIYIVRHVQSRIDQTILKGASGGKTRALMSVIVRQPRSLPRFAYQKMAEGARFENPEACETIGPHLVSSYQSQSLAEESEVGEEPIKPDRTR